MSDETRRKGVGNQGARAQVRKSAEARREQLVACAMESYLELGLGRAGHGDVAKRAGVSTGTVFNYFPSRRELTMAVLDRVRARVLEVLDSVGEPTASVEANVALIRDTLDKAARDGTQTEKLLLSWGNSFAPDLRVSFLGLQGEMLARLQRYVRPGPRAEVDARILLGAGTMYLQMRFDGTGEAVMRAFGGRLGELIAG